jgi:hypothetical protein
MQSLVLQLQGECLDSSVSILEILRKALVVARKLEVKDFQAWIDNELNGYDDVADLPPYRVIHGHLQCWDSHQDSWIPLFVKDVKFAEIASRCNIDQSLGELDDLVRVSNKNTGVLIFPFTSTQELILDLGEGYRPARHVSGSRVAAIIDAVRNVVLDWTLKLEEDGVLGEGLTFSSKERETAAHGNYTINYHGPVNNSQIQQGSQHSAQSMSVAQTDFKAVGEWLQSLKDQIAELKLNSADTAQIQADVQAAESQLASPRPNRVVIEACMQSLTNILEGCTGSLLAAGLLHKLVGA